jgi:aminoglycoside 6'-N-acetyltransferase I
MVKCRVMRWTVREMGPADRQAWARMRAALWPDEDAKAHAEGIDAVLGNPAMWGFIAETADDGPIGFAELALRPFANGCDSQPVAFLEGI